MPGELMGEDGVLSVAVECLSADGDDLAFDLFELGGSFAWSAGVKDNGDAEFFSGSMKQDFAVGADWISRFNRQVSSSVKDRRVMFCIPADIVGAYGFSLEFAVCSISTLTPLKMSFNGRNVFSGVSLERYRDYRVRLPAECVTGGTNTLWYTSDNAQGDAVWINFDYMRLVPHAKKGLAVNVR